MVTHIVNRVCNIGVLSPHYNSAPSAGKTRSHYMHYDCVCDNELINNSSSNRQQITAISKGNTPVFIPEAPPHKIKTDSSVSKDDAKLSVHSMVASACQIQLDPKTAVQQFDSPQKSRLTQLITEVVRVTYQLQDEC